MRLRSKKLRRIRKTLEFQSVTSRVKKKHGGMLAGFASELDARRDQKVAIGSFESSRECFPVLHIEHDAKVARWNMVAIDRVRSSGSAAISNQVHGDLMAKEV